MQVRKNSEKCIGGLLSFNPSTMGVTQLLEGPAAAVRALLTAMVRVRVRGRGRGRFLGIGLGLGIGIGLDLNPNANPNANQVRELFTAIMVDSRPANPNPNPNPTPTPTPTPNPDPDPNQVDSRHTDCRLSKEELLLNEVRG